MALFLIISDDSGVGRIRPGIHGAPIRPATACFQPLLRGLGGKESGFLPHDLGGQLTKRSDVVHDPDAPAVRGKHEVRFAGMYHDVADGHAGKLMAFVLSPVVSAVQGNPKAKFRAQVKNVLGNGIFLDHMCVAAHTAVTCDDGSPGLPIIRCLVNVGGHVSKRMAVKCSISSASVIQPRLDPGNPRKLWKVCHITYDVVPGFSTIARELQVAIIGTNPDRLRVSGRFADRVDRRVHLGE